MLSYAWIQTDRVEIAEGLMSLGPWFFPQLAVASACALPDLVSSGCLFKNTHDPKPMGIVHALSQNRQVWPGSQSDSGRLALKGCLSRLFNSAAVNIHSVFLTRSILPLSYIVSIQFHVGNTK